MLVAFIDDEAFSTWAPLPTRLRMSQHTVVEFLNTDDFMHWFEGDPLDESGSGSPQVAVIDVLVGGSHASDAPHGAGGLGLARAIRALPRAAAALPIVFLTAAGSDHLVRSVEDTMLDLPNVTKLSKLERLNKIVGHIETVGIG